MQYIEVIGDTVLYFLQCSFKTYFKMSQNIYDT